MPDTVKKRARGVAQYRAPRPMQIIRGSREEADQANTLPCSYRDWHSAGVTLHEECQWDME